MTVNAASLYVAVQVRGVWWLCDANPSYDGRYRAVARMESDADLAAIERILPMEGTLRRITASKVVVRDGVAA